MKNNFGLGKRITAFALAIMLLATSTNYTVFADEIQADNTETVDMTEAQSQGEDAATENTESAEPVENTEIMESSDVQSAGEQSVKAQQGAENEIATYANVTIKNDGYPYGKNMTSSSVTLVMDVEGTASSYQWQSASTEDGSYTNISGATSNTYTFTPSSGTWYKCVVNGNIESKAIETVKPGSDSISWTKPYCDYNMNMYWYISNGTMAYMANDTKFDVTGLYKKSGTLYMLCTSYGKYWNLYSSTTSNPGATPYISSQNASLDALRVAFNENDSYDIIFEADLAEGQRAFSFGCDTQLGNSSTSGNYSDYAALSAMTKDGKLKQVSMIGAAGINTAADDDPAFVIAPMSDNSLFWIGYYGSRKTYAYNEMDQVSNGYRTKKIDGKNVVTSMEGLDSGMTMSWTNLESGSTVKFRFGVGSVKDTGAINGKVDYVKEKITGLEKNTTYTITVEGSDETYTVTSDENGEIPLEGKDGNNKEYDFIGKTISMAKADSDASADMDISGRPDTPDNPSDLDNPTDSKPEVDAKIEITELTTDSVTISPKNGQQYAYSTDGNNWTILGDTNKDSSGNYVVSGLNAGSTVYVRTRIAATNNEPASEWSAATSITLKNTVKAQISGYTGEYDGNEHSIAVDQIDVGASIKYSLAENGVYDTAMPKKKDAGTYRVYYRVEKDGCYPSCGSVSINISRKPITIKWSDTTFKYDGTAKLPTAEIVDGVLAGDIENCQVNVSLNGYGNAIAVGTYTASASINNNNYVIGSEGNKTFKIVKGDRNAPKLTAEPETISGKKDGKIDGLTTEMEYAVVTSATAGVSSDITVGDYTAVENVDMTLESGTYAVRYKENDNYEASAYTLVTINEGRKLTITLPAEQNGYTIGCDRTQVSYGDSVTLSISLKSGWSKADDFDIKANGQSLLNSVESTDRLTISNIVEDQIITVTGVVDRTKPSGEIKIGEENSWKSFINDITFGLFFKERQQVTVEASDNESGVKSVEYYLFTPKADSAELSIDDMESINDWTDLIDEREFYIDPDAKYVIYVKITDNAGNVTYISSNGIVLDNTAPVIKGITDGKSYCQDLEITVEDVNLKSVTYQIDDGEINELVASSEGKYTIPVRTFVDDQEQKAIKVVATDNAGNTKAINIKAAHEYNWTVVIAPSVLYKGYTLHTCTHDRSGVPCGKSYKDNILPATGVDGLVLNNKRDLEYVIDKASEHLNDTDEELSDDDKAFYEEVLEAATKMHDNILKAEDLIAEINAINNNISDSDSVNSDDMQNISDVLTKVDDLLDEKNAETPTASLTDDQKELLEKLKEDVVNKQNIVKDISASIVEIDSQVEDINKIDDIQPDDQKSLEDILDNIGNLLDKKSNLTSDELTKIEDYQKQMLEKLKESAKKDIDNDLEKTKKQIEATISDPTEKKAALESAEKIAQDAIESISKADSKASLCETRDDGKSKLDLITKDISDVKKSVSENIKNIYNDKVSNINDMSDLTDEERSKALSDLETEMNKAISEISEVKTKDDVVEIFDNVKSKFDNIESKSADSDIANAKDKAKAAVREDASKANDAISDMADLKEDEKTQAKANVKAAVDTAIEVIDAATDKDGISAAKDTGLTAIDDQKIESAKTDLSNAKTKAKEDIKNKADAIKKAIDEMPNLTEEEKNEANTTIDEIVSNANGDIDDIIDPAKKTDVSNKRDETYKILEQIETAAVKGDISNMKEAAKSDIDSKADEAKEAIDQMEDLTPEQKSEAKAEIDKKAEEAKKAVDGIKAPTGKNDVEDVRKDIESKKTDVSADIEKKQEESSATNDTNAKENVKKAEEAVKKAETVIGDIKISSIDETAIEKEVKSELNKSGVNNADVTVSDLNKTPAKLHEKGRITGTVEIKVGSTTKTVDVNQELPELSTFVDYDSKVEKDAPKSEVTVDKDKLMDNVLSENEIAALENGSTADILLHIKNKDMDTLEQDKALIVKEITDNEQIGKYLDISLLLNITDSDGNKVVEDQKISEAETMFTITVDIPKDLIASGNVIRTYQIVRVHDGVAETLDSEYDESAQTLTFATDRFSTYAIVYSDTEKQIDKPSGDNKPATGDSSNGGNSNAGNQSVQQPAALSAKADTTKKAGTKTGDNNNALPFVVLMLAGAAAVVAGRKKKVNR